MEASNESLVTEANCRFGKFKPTVECLTIVLSKTFVIDLLHQLIVMFCVHRFDLEIHKVNEQLKEQRSLREKIQKERDNLITEKFSLEQEYKVCTASR